MGDQLRDGDKSGDTGEDGRLVEDRQTNEGQAGTNENTDDRLVRDRQGD